MLFRSDVPEGEGYSVFLKEGKIQVNLVKRWLDDAVRVESEPAVSSDRWNHVTVVYDGSRVADGIKIYLNGAPVAIGTNVDLLNQNFASASPLRIGGGHGPNGRFRGKIAGVRVFNQALDASTCLSLAAEASIVEILAKPHSERSAAEAMKLQGYFLATAAPAELAQAHSLVEELERSLTQLIESCPTTMVMAELQQPRPTRILVRGEYDKPGEQVTPDTPRCLPQMPKTSPTNRLGFARWLAQPSHPLTSRVVVNRCWQMLFGTGLVKTVDDFGAQGEPPTHQELLDWLAVEFAAPMTPVGQAPNPSEQADAEAWRLKRLLRLMITSATYRQASNTSSDLLQRDPENRLLARGPRVRLSAEMVRDQALLASGLLVEKLGGPSVKPYQPAGLWKELGDNEYQQDHGPGLYRRSLYTFWKRTVPPPTLLIFDAANRETCIVRESRTNTPLQALILMNDVTYIEAARAMAWRVMHEIDGSIELRLEAAFQLATSRKPRLDELEILGKAWHAQRDRFRQDIELAKSILSQGESVLDSKFDPCELAAFTTICSLILNLDEVITKE